MTQGLYEFELGKAADTIVRELFKLKAGETLIITADTESSEKVVNATARAAFAVGAKPMVVWLASPLGVGQVADPMLPLDALTGALKGADAWVEFNNKWLLYSTAHTRAMAENKKLRYLNLVGMNPDMMVRCIGRVDHIALKDFLHQAAKIAMAAKHVRFTSPSGTDLEFDNVSGRLPLIRDGYADKPGTYMMAGMIAWTPALETINGMLVFDGSLVPPCGKLAEPIRLTIEAGQIVNIEGGMQAREFQAYLDHFDHPQMKRLAHAVLGFGPGAKLTGDIVEDERIWGCTEWGIGHIGKYLMPPDGVPAPSHSDGQSLSSSVWLDGKAFTDRGTVVDKGLAKLAKAFGKT
jgi:leucyl aminopeptidase (aminopeptidase T)